MTGDLAMPSRRGTVLLYLCPQIFYQRQVSVNLAKTKVVKFRSKAALRAFLFNGNAVERVESYKYHGFEFHATKNLAHGVSQLVSAAKKAMHCMNRRCVLLLISDPKLRCFLADYPFQAMLARCGCGMLMKG